MSYDTNSWFGFGDVSELNNDIDRIQEATGLNWNLTMEDVEYRGDSVMDNRYVLTRDDTGMGLEVVSGSYNVFQPRDMLEYARDIAKESGGIIESAGALKDGKLTFAAINFGEKEGPVVNDKHSKYFLLLNGNDATRGVTVNFISYRLWCQNMVRAAITGRGAENHYRFRHSSSLNDRLAEILDMLTLREQYEEMEQVALEAMVDFRMSEANRIAFAMASVSPELQYEYDGQELNLQVPEEFIPSDALATRRRNQIDEIMGLVDYGMGHQETGIAGSAYAGYQAVAQYIDHRSEGERQFMQSVAGSGLRMKDRAFNIASAMAMA